MKLWSILRRQRAYVPRPIQRLVFNPDEWIIRPWGMFRRGTEAAVLAEKLQ